MASIIMQYYEGILRHLRSRVDHINTLFQHQGVKGEGNEKVLRDLLELFVPRRYGVGTGIVIDKDGNQSRQCDIVIFDNMLYPSLLSLSEVHLFPVDIVYATIEVKTTLDAASAQEAAANILSVRTLNLVPGKFVLPQSIPAEGGGTHLTFPVFDPTPPLGFVFAYNSAAQQLETFKRWFSPASQDALQGSASIIACLDQGLLYYRAPDGRISTQPDPSATFTAISLPLLGPDRHPVNIDDAKGPFAMGDRAYPVKSARQRNVVVDQSRVLLAFLLMMQELLNAKQISPKVNFARQYFADRLLRDGVML